jgi:hypothetical protein
MVKQSAMVCASGKCGPTCIIAGLFSAAFGAAALWVIIGTIMKQWAGMGSMTNLFLWYFGGLILVCIAKCIKMKTCGMCRGM